MSSVIVRRLRVLAFDRGGGLAVATLLLYVWVTPHHIVDGDNAEFVTASVVGGVPHPSGYPLFVLWLRAMSWLPGANPAHTAAIATAILGAATVLVLHAAARAWGARPLAATLAVAIFAAAPVVIRVSTEAEVFAMNNLVVATVLWLAARAGPLRGVWRVTVLALVAGLGLSDHLTCILVAPVGILGAVRGIREASAPRAATIALAVGALGLGLVPYGYLLATAETPVTWRHFDGLGDVVHHFRRLDYGNMMAPSRERVALGDNLGALAGMLGRTWLWVGLLAGLGVLGLRAVRPAPEGQEPRWGWVMLAASFLLAGPLIAVLFNIPPVGIGLVLCHRFHLMPALLLAVPVAAAFDLLATRASGALSPRLRAPWFGGTLGVLAFVALASRSLPLHSPAVERSVGNLLRSLPPDAVIIVANDDQYFGCLYRQLVIGERPDVTVIVYGQLLNAEYRGRLHARTGVVMLAPGDRTPSVSIAEDALARGRPMFVDQSQNNVLSQFPTYPYGAAFRVLPHDAARPPIEEVFVTNQKLYAAFDLDYPVPGPDDDFARYAHERYARIWRIIARALAAANHRPEAAVAADLAARLAP